MKATTTHDVRIWWGTELPKGTELEVEVARNGDDDHDVLYNITVPDDLSDCYISGCYLEIQYVGDTQP
jgi:hypothetical protein